MIIGTSHFVNKRAAIAYYAQYENGDKLAAREVVARKLKEGQIHLGPPDLLPGESLTRCDEGARYAVVLHG